MAFKITLKKIKLPQILKKEPSQKLGTSWAQDKDDNIVGTSQKSKVTKVVDLAKIGTRKV